MSTTIFPKKRVPISVSLGINNQLMGNENFYDEMFSHFSVEKHEAVLFKTDHSAFICKNNGKTSFEKKELIVFLAVRRAFALKNHTRLPVYLAVKSQNIGKQIVKELARHSTDYKLYNMISSLKNKLNKDLLEKNRTKADFILITYTQLRKLVFSKVNPASEFMVLVNPLTKRNGHREAITLDDIIIGLHRHKSKKPYFTFIIDANYFPVIGKKDYQNLLKVKDCFFFGCEENNDSLFHYKFQNTLEHIKDEHIQFFVLRELFRKNSLLEWLDDRFKESIAYKLHLYSNNIFPQRYNLEDETYSDIKKQKELLDKKIYRKIAKTLKLFSKKTTKRIPGEKQVDINNLEKIDYSWGEVIDSPPFLPIINKNEDKKYSLTSLGLGLLISISYYSGIKTSLTSFLKDLAFILYRNKQPPYKLTIVEVVKCFSKLVGAEQIDLPVEFLSFSIKDISKQEEKELIKSFNYFVEREFGYIIKDYTGYAAITFLDAFEELMDENALYFYKRMKEYRSKKQQKREFDLTEAIYNTVKNKPLMINEIMQKLKTEEKTVRKVLAKLEKEGKITSIKTVTNNGTIRVRYCHPETLARFPHLKKNCGDCPVYDRKFQNCPLIINLVTYDPTAIPAEYYDYVMNKVKEFTTACELIDELDELVVEGEKIRYTMSKEDFEQKKGVVEGDYLLGQEEKTNYCCVTCETVIEDFGSGEEIIFPRRGSVICPNCSTGYLLKDDGRILIQTEHKDMLRKMYYKATGSIPKELEERKPSFGYVIYDKEHADIKMLEDGSIALEICDNKVPLEKVQYVYFAGKEHLQLERFLNKLLNVRPDLFKYNVNRTQREEKEIELRDDCKPFTSEQYRGLHEFVNFVSEEEMLNSSILKARQLSNIGALLKYRKTLQENGKLATKVNKQLANMNDLLLIAQSGINSSFYGRQLEGLNQDCLFNLLKESGEKVGLWTHGRVNSRLVKNPFISTPVRSSNASSPLDALLNQVLRQFRSEINKIYQKIGWKPSSLGAGFYHRRKSKSDIDRKGFYFDFDEPVGSLALLTLLTALEEGLFSIDDCYLTTDGKGRAVYRVKNSSLTKIEKIVDDGLSELVFYRGECVPFLVAFEDNLYSFRQAVEKWLLINKDGEKSASETIDQCLDSADYFPFVFCPADCEEELTILHNSTKKFSFLFEEREDQVLAARENRESFREEGMKKWLISNGKKGKAKIKLTKHQLKEQERSLLVVLLMLQLSYYLNGFFGYYSTKRIRELLQLNQNQSQRILTKMINQGLLLKVKSENQCYYQLNLENKTINKLLLSLGKTPKTDSDKSVDLLDYSNNFFERISSLLLKNQQAKEGLRVTIGWKGWEMPRNIEPIIKLVEEKLANSREKLGRKKQ